MNNYTETYAELQHQLHTENEHYGTSGSKYADYVLKIASSMKTKDILDYGCGKSTLQKSLPFPIHQYDPFIPEHSNSPQPANLVVCTDVMEHIEPEFIGNVIHDINKLTLQLVFFQIATGPARKTLADGRNAHLTQRNANWWLEVLMPYFNVENVSTMESGFIFIGTPIPSEL